jgi:Hsp70 protein
MPYVLGIDLGATHTAAAVCGLDAPTGDPAGNDVEIVRLGEHTDTVDSVLYLQPDGSLVIGAAAARRASGNHHRVARGFTARIGDAVPMVLGGRQYLAQDLAAAMISWVVDQVRAARGEPPEHVVVTHHSSWGPYRRGLLEHALHRYGLDGVTLLPRSVAAAEGQDADGLLAVHDLGEEPVEASVVLRRTPGPVRLIGTAEGPGWHALTVDTLTRTVRSAAGPGQLDAVLLVGGSCRLPAVAEEVGARLPARVVVDTEPELTVARGAALAARRVARPSLHEAPAAPPALSQGSLQGPAAPAAPAVDDLDAPPPRPPVEIRPLEFTHRRSSARFMPGRPVVIGTLMTVVVVVGMTLTLVFFSDAATGGSPLNQPATSRPAAPVAPMVPVAPAAGVPQSGIGSGGGGDHEGGHEGGR